MEEKSKLFVFDRLEVVIIFLFMVVLAVTCFTLGVSIGKKFAIRSAGIIPEDQQNIILKSKTEEYVDEVIEENKNEMVEEKAKSDSLAGNTIKRLTEEFEELDENTENPSEATKKVLEGTKDAPAPKAAATAPAKNEDESSLVGKFTIQLGSYQNLEDAKNFADGFTVRGYNPIINEVKLGGRGIWYRVSLGLFENMNEAKEYIQKEKSLFQGQNYIIAEIK